VTRARCLRARYGGQGRVLHRRGSCIWPSFRSWCVCVCACVSVRSVAGSTFCQRSLPSSERAVEGGREPETGLIPGGGGQGTQAEGHCNSHGELQGLT
jgi:hypothetical protein